MSATGPLYEVVETDRAIISTTTVVSLLAVLCLLLAAYALSLQLLPRSSSGKIRILFIWHLFDALTHFLLEGSFLYCVFFSTVASSTLLPGDDSGRLLSSLHRPLLPHDVHFLNNGDVMRGAFYGSHPFAKLWQEYARADARWGVADPGVVSLELLTVGLMGPLAVYICFLLRKGSVKEGSAWFWMTVVAASELYGGFMTFAPEWLTGSPNLDTSNFMFTWVYLFFFNTLWVWIPLWILWEAHNAMTAAFADRHVGTTSRKRL